MSALLKITKELLTVHNRRPRKSLGQNFLVDPQVLQRIINAAELSSYDVVLEIGTGLGVLTDALAENSEKVITLDPDKEMIQMAKKVLAKHSNVEYISESFLIWDFSSKGDDSNHRLLPFNKIVANVPYYITTPIIEKILSWEKRPDLVVLTVQKEVAERIVSNPGSKRYGSFSVFVQNKAEAKIKSFVSRRSFYPAPNVESAILVLKPYEKPLYDIDERIVRSAFSQRRKTIKNSLKQFNIGFEKIGIDSKRRPETLSLEEFEKISLSCKPLNS